MPRSAPPAGNLVESNLGQAKLIVVSRNPGAWAGLLSHLPWPYALETAYDRALVAINDSHLLRAVVIHGILRPDNVSGSRGNLRWTRSLVKWLALRRFTGLIVVLPEDLASLKGVDLQVPRGLAPAQLLVMSGVQFLAHLNLILARDLMQPATPYEHVLMAAADGSALDSIVPLPEILARIQGQVGELLAV